MLFKKPNYIKQTCNIAKETRRVNVVLQKSIYAPAEE
jgi:hypothetical protein